MNRPQSNPTLQPNPVVPQFTSSNDLHSLGKHCLDFHRFNGIGGGHWLNNPADQKVLLLGQGLDRRPLGSQQFFGLNGFMRERLGPILHFTQLWPANTATYTVGKKPQFRRLETQSARVLRQWRGDHHRNSVVRFGKAGEINAQILVAEGACENGCFRFKNQRLVDAWAHRACPLESRKLKEPYPATWSAKGAGRLADDPGNNADRSLRRYRLRK